MQTTQAERHAAVIRRVAVLGTALAVSAVLLSAAEPSPLQSLPYTPSLDVGSMDRSVDPCEDLYTYSCGGWQRQNPIPPEETSWSVYGKLHAANQQFLWGILQDAARATRTRSPTEQKIGDYFAACSNVAAIEQAGAAPLAPQLALIDGLHDKHDLGALLGELHARVDSGGILFGVDAEQDARDATREIAGIGAGGLGLPDRDYYTKDDAKSIATRTRYVAHVEKMLTLLGQSPAAAHAAAAVIMRIETALARASLTMVEKRDPYQIYHRETLASLQKSAPELDWRAYFHAAGLKPEPWLNVSEPRFVQQLNERIAGESLADLKTYLKWRVLDAGASYLSSAFVAENFAFNRAYLRGAEQDRPRWKKCVAWVDRDLGEALGREFVARAFPPAMKAKTLQLTREIEAAMRVRIGELDWMTARTKAQALAKLAAVSNKIGYPDRWRNYSALAVLPDDFFADVTRATEFEWHRQAAKIGKPVDRGEWLITAATVDAYYNPQMNDINFPAAVLLPPLYDPKMDDAPNYGDTGGTIGHELTHAFDDEGRQFDGAGNLRNWWSKQDAVSFESRAQCVRDQYSQYPVVDEVKINGALTSGEDIADLGGELLGFMAWKQHTRNLTLPVADGLTAAQRFFVGFAQWACSNERPENLRANAITDPHSPPRYRINGVVVNMPQFAAAFHCGARSPLVKPAAKVCKIW